MKIERKCLQCEYSAEDQSPQRQLTIIGHRPHVCLHGPICGSAVASGNGGVVAITLYPQVNEQTISCARFQPKRGQFAD